MKRLLSLLLAFAMVASYLPVTAGAEETLPAQTAAIETVPVETEAAETVPETTEEVTPETTVETVPELPLPQRELPVIPDMVMELPTATTSGYSFATFARDANGNPGLKPGNHEKWIDRVELEAYAINLYNWLVENSDNDQNADALIDVTQGEEYLYTDAETSETLAEGYVHYLTMIGGDIRLELPYDVDADTFWNAFLEEAYALMGENLDKVSVDVCAVFDAFDRDHPEVFWLEGRSVRTSFGYYDPEYNGSVWVIDYEQDFLLDLSVADYEYGETFDVRAAGYQSASAIRSGITKRDNAVNAILAQIPDNTNAANKVTFFNDWLTKHNGYNTSNDLYAIGYDCRECLSALTGSVGTNGPVCEGYARAFKVLCDASNIQCVLVNGDANNDGSIEPHMWNYVNLLGSWYGVDVTWNDPGSGSNAISGYECEDYLLLGGSTKVDGMAFSQSHPVSNMVTDGGVAFTNGPKLSEKDYCVHSFSAPAFRFENEIFYADFTCTKCEITETVPGVITDKQINAATATKDGSIVYTVAFTSPDGKEYTHTHTEVIPATGEQEGFIDNGTLGENLTWTLDQNGKLTISGTGDMDRCALESQVPWAAYRDQILTVVIEEGVTSIGDYAFYECWKLEEVSLPQSLEAIYKDAFYFCKSLKSVTIPDAVVLISSNAFYLCESMTTLDLGKSVAHIGESAFDCCRALTEVTIPASVSTIDAYAFRSCEGLETVTFEGRWPVISSSAFNGDTFNAYYPADEDTWTADKLTNYGGRIIWHAVSGGGEVVPQNPSGKCGENLTWTLDLTTGVLTISGTGYMDDKDSSIYKPWYEYQEQITKVVIEEGVTSAGKNMFAQMPNLTEVQLPKSLRIIKAGAFEMSEKLKAIDLTYVERVESAAFHSCTALTEVTIPDGIILEGSSYPDNRGVFTGCTGIKKVTVGNFSNGYALFSGCTALTEVNLQEGMEVLGGHMFDGCTALKTVNIPAGADIGGGAFANCTSLTNVTFTREIGTVGEKAFTGCTGLTSFTFPQVEALSGSIFFLCDNLSTIKFKGSSPTFDRHTLNNLKVTIYYPSGDSSWNDKINGHFGANIDTWVAYGVTHTYESKVTKPTCVDQGYTTYLCTDCGYSYVGTEISALGHDYQNGTCTRCGKVEPVHVHSFDSTTHQCSCGVYGGVCGDNLTWTLADGNLTIHGTGTMDFCEYMKYPWSNYSDNILNLIIENGVTRISTYAFSNCINLQSVIIPETVQSISPSAFSNCKKLPSITIPESVTYIGEYAFDGCSNLEGIWIDEQNPEFSSDEFGVLFDKEKTKIVEVPEAITGEYIIPSSVTVIFDAFDGCTQLTSVSIPDGVTFIGEFAFYGCSNLTAILFNGGAPSFGEDVFYGVTAIASYPAADSSWTVEKMQNYGGTITWVPYSNHTHSFTNYVSNNDATCTTDGTKTAKCDYCDVTDTVADAGSAKGHSYSSEVTAPTCVDQGYTTYLCTDCGYSYQGNFVAATGVHTYLSEHDSTCEICGFVREMVESDTIPFSDAEWAVLKLVNQERTKAGLAPVTGFALLQDAAGIRADEQAELYSHTRPDGRSCFTVLEDLGIADIDYIYAGENIAYGYRSAAAVMDGWMNSQGHRENILFSNFQHIGVGELSTYYWVQLFTSGSGYSSISVAVPEDLSIDPGTSIDALNLIATLNSKEHGKCYLPVAAAYCTGYDPAKTGDQTVTITVSGVSTTFILHVHNWDTSGCTAQKVCTHCGEAIGAGSGHSYGAWTETKAPTCTEKGEERRECSKCGDAETREVAAKGHSYTSVITKPTCTEKGYTTYTCACGDSYTDNETAALGHSWDNGQVTKEPTESAEGEKTYTCTACGETKTETLPKLDHIHSYDAVVTAPTCTEKGYTTYTCACGDSYTGSETAATGHSYGDWAESKAATCTEKGEERRDCANCDHFETQETKAKGHTEVVDPGVDPTCTKTGKTEGKHCEICGEILIAQEEIPATGHKWDNGQITKEPTATEAGVKTYTCTACGETKTEAIPAIGEEIVWGDANGDGKVNTKDATRILRYYAGLISDSEIDLVAADVNGDGNVNTKDATRILR
ncbi:MAG: leucine-rich repeat protein, partial [Oscillospiraceae bacterium]|nr:leucine-rich repeat protein [Oscillospiraceae bacterium]